MNDRTVRECAFLIAKSSSTSSTIACIINETNAREMIHAIHIWRKERKGRYVHRRKIRSNIIEFAGYNADRELIWRLIGKNNKEETTRKGMTLANKNIEIHKRLAGRLAKAAVGQRPIRLIEIRNLTKERLTEILVYFGAAICTWSNDTVRLIDYQVDVFNPNKFIIHYRTTQRVDGIIVNNLV